MEPSESKEQSDPDSRLSVCNGLGSSKVRGMVPVHELVTVWKLNFGVQ